MKHWQFIQQKLEQDQSVYLLTVIQHKGSSPGRQGFKMVVADDHEIYGSIGGGIMEYNLVELCKEILNSKEPAPFVKHQIHKGKIVDGSGMIRTNCHILPFKQIAFINNRSDFSNIFLSRKRVVIDYSGSFFIYP